MKSTLYLIAVVTMLSAADASAQVSVEFSAPTIHFEVVPPMVEVHPGVTVVEDYDEEVFFTGGWYWVRRDAHWFRTRDCRRPRWEHAHVRYVPVTLVRMERGKYRRWHRPRGHGWQRSAHDHGHAHGHDHGHDHDRRGHERHAGHGRGRGHHR